MRKTNTSLDGLRKRKQNLNIHQCCVSSGGFFLMTKDAQKIQETQNIIAELRRIMDTQQNNQENIDQQSGIQPGMFFDTATLPEPSQPSTMILYQKHQIHEESIRTCDLCKKDFILGKNLSGLVVENTFFACEECCSKTQHNDMLRWTKSKMTKHNTVRPIGVWLTQEKNKSKTLLFKH